MKTWNHERPQWKRVLHSIYEAGSKLEGYGRGKKGITDEHPLVKELKISGTSLIKALGFLQDQGLIEYDKGTYNWIILTEKGFNVAHANEKSKVEKELQITSALLSAVLVLTIVFQFFHSIGTVNSFLLLILYAALVMSMAFVFLSYEKSLR